MRHQAPANTYSFGSISALPDLIDGVRNYGTLIREVVFIDSDQKIVIDTAASNAQSMALAELMYGDCAQTPDHSARARMLYPTRIPRLLRLGTTLPECLSTPEADFHTFEEREVVPAHQVALELIRAALKTRLFTEVREYFNIYTGEHLIVGLTAYDMYVGRGGHVICQWGKTVHPISYHISNRAYCGVLATQATEIAVINLAVLLLVMHWLWAGRHTRVLVRPPKQAKPHTVRHSRPTKRHRQAASPAHKLLRVLVCGWLVAVVTCFAPSAIGTHRHNGAIVDVFVHGLATPFVHGLATLIVAFGLMALTLYVAISLFVAIMRLMLRSILRAFGHTAPRRNPRHRRLMPATPDYFFT